MSMLTGAPELVMRNVVMDAEPVRIGRRSEPQPMRRPGGDTPVAPAAAAASDRDAVLAEALAQARAEGTRLGREEGLRSGHEEGLKKGQADAQAAGRAALEKAVAEATTPLRERERQLAALIAALGDEQARWRTLAEDEAVALAYELGCRVVGAALLTPDGVRAQAQQLLAAAREREPVFHVHPDDARILQEHGATPELRCVADPAVRSGGCLLKGASGSLDARLETILQQCRQGLLEARAQGPAAATGQEQ